MFHFRLALFCGRAHLNTDSCAVSVLNEIDSETHPLMDISKSIWWILRFSSLVFLSVVLVSYISSLCQFYVFALSMDITGYRTTSTAAVFGSAFLWSDFFSISCCARSDRVERVCFPKIMAPFTSEHWLQNDGDGTE